MLSLKKSALIFYALLLLLLNFAFRNSAVAAPSTLIGINPSTGAYALDWDDDRRDGTEEDDAGGEREDKEFNGDRGSAGSGQLARTAKRKLRKRKVKRICRRYKKGLLPKTCQGEELQKKRAACDADDDALNSRNESRWTRTNPFQSDTDGDSLLDGEELCLLGTNPRKWDTDGDGTSDGEDPDTGTPSNCDQEGNTSSFGIPAGLIGNVFQGETDYQQTCAGCHNPASGIRGQGREYGYLESVLSSAPMSLNLPDQQIADIVAFLNKDNCVFPNPTPDASPQPSASPSPDPTGSPGSCDTDGNTSAFGIPVGLTGNINRGSDQFTASCSRCHSVDRGTNYPFDTLKTAIAGSPMFISDLSDAQVADLTAYLNRAQCNGATPTPTPSDPKVRGQLLWEARCSSCHSKPRDFNELTRRELEEEISEENEMNGISLSDQEFDDLLTYLHGLN